MGDNWHKLEPHTNGNGVICLRTTYCKNKILVTPGVLELLASLLVSRPKGHDVL